LMMRAFHHSRGDTQRTRMLVPDSAHGTNPASAAMCGFEVATIPGDDDGEVDLKSLERSLDPSVAAIMLTNPNTLGLFETRILDICRMAHDAGALAYYDGANLNAIVGIARPGDMGFDVVHLNLHKTFSTPHGGGGPGAGPVGVKARLADYLPVPYVKKIGDWHALAEDRPKTIGRVCGFHGNAGVLVKAYAYIRRHGAGDLASVARHAVLNAAYLRKRLSARYRLATTKPPMHEFVICPTPEMLEKGVRALHIAKRLIDFGYHPPTVYFPLVVKEAIMIEPTETETKDTLDRFCDAMDRIADEAMENPKLLLEAPHNAPVGRVDETKAARELRLRYCVSR
ncbi:MAG: aminomethyl-transferring glycine dehydrogenase subunit GcvPB, partial [Planctomycetota bacterium]|nr:aminomethyl-transferring glycine dehydrogenase subunit GcvPB [Planctomycetota bacterium]